MSEVLGAASPPADSTDLRPPRRRVVLHLADPDPRRRAGRGARGGRGRDDRRRSGAPTRRVRSSPSACRSPPSARDFFEVSRTPELQRTLNTLAWVLGGVRRAHRPRCGAARTLGGRTGGRAAGRHRRHRRAGGGRGPVQPAAHHRGPRPGHPRRVVQRDGRRPHRADRARRQVHRRRQPRAAVAAHDPHHQRAAARAPPGRAARSAPARWSTSSVTEVERFRQVVDDLLELGRLDAGEATAPARDRQVVDARELVREALATSGRSDDLLAGAGPTQPAAGRRRQAASSPARWSTCSTTPTGTGRGDRGDGAAPRRAPTRRCEVVVDDAGPGVAAARAGADLRAVRARRLARVAARAPGSA